MGGGLALLQEEDISVVNLNCDELFKGSIDMHIHHGISRMSNAYDPFDIAEEACEKGMRAIVFKDTGYMNGPIALFINQKMPENFKVFGSLVLNNYCGGVNVDAVEAAWRYGAKVIWMPTQSSANSVAKLKQLGVPVKGDGISLVTKSGKLIDAMYPVLDSIAAHDMVLATGHISPEEDFAVVEGAIKAGVKNIVLTHPIGSEIVMDKCLTVEETKELTDKGAYAEFTFVFMLPTEQSQDPHTVIEQMRAIGPERCLISTDLGVFTHNIGPVEGFRMYINTLAVQGMTEEEITYMAKKNPAKILGLDA